MQERMNTIRICYSGRSNIIFLTKIDVKIQTNTIIVFCVFKKYLNLLLIHFQVEALRTIEALTETEINDSMWKYNQDKKEVERNITRELREIEEANEEIAYYKSICIPNEEETMEVKRL